MLGMFIPGSAVHYCTVQLLHNDHYVCQNEQIMLQHTCDNFGLYHNTTQL